MKKIFTNNVDIQKKRILKPKITKLKTAVYTAQKEKKKKGQMVSIRVQSNSLSL